MKTVIIGVITWFFIQLPVGSEVLDLETLKMEIGLGTEIKPEESWGVDKLIFNIKFTIESTKGGENEDQEENNDPRFRDVAEPEGQF